MAALNGLNYCYNLIGFATQQHRQRLQDDGLATFEDFRNVMESDIGDMAEAFAKRSIAEGKIIFSHGRTKRLKGLMHWIQDCFRCNDQVDHNDFTLDAVHEALARAAAGKVEADQSDITSTAAKPKQFTKESDWPSFSQAFQNYLSTIPGVFGVPLKYVIRDIAVPEADAVYNTFTERAIARTPLVGANFEAGARRMHQLSKSLIQGLPAKNWTQHLIEQQDGRQD